MYDLCDHQIKCSTSAQDQLASAVQCMWSGPSLSIHKEIKWN